MIEVDMKTEEDSRGIIIGWRLALTSAPLLLKAYSAPLLLLTPPAVSTISSTH